MFDYETMPPEEIIRGLLLRGYDSWIIASFREDAELSSSDNVRANIKRKLYDLLKRRFGKGE